MKENDLKKLGRAELLEMLIEQTKEVNRLQKELDEANEKLASREITIENAGSIAEAALQLNGVFDAAQRAAQQYLDNLTGIQDYCDRLESESRAKSEKLLAETQAQCDEMVRKAKEESLSWWDSVSKRLETFYAERPGLRESLTDHYKRTVQGKGR